MCQSISARDAAALFCCLAALVSCVPENATRPVEWATIDVVEGAEQEGVAGELLPFEIVVTAHRHSGRPASGVRLVWTPDEGGRITPPISVTDANGRAKVRWQLGLEDGEHHATAVADGVAPLTITALSDSTNAIPLNAPLRVDVQTYDGSGQAVHPDYVAEPRGHAVLNYLALTPYPWGDVSYENPELYKSHDRRRWVVPSGAPAPLARPQMGYLSDPDVVYDPDRGELLLYYREKHFENRIYLIRSVDGVAWTPPELVVSAPNDQLISPSVVRRGPRDWLMWSVNGRTGCSDPAASVELRRSVDGHSWSEPQAVSLTQAGFFPWHIDVRWIESRQEYWAVYPVKPARSCTTPALYLATSRDGVEWTTYPSAVLERGTIAELQDIVYRATFDYDPARDIITFWYSGARYDGRAFDWRTVVQRRRRADVFTQIELPKSRAVRGARANVPALTDPP